MKKLLLLWLLATQVVAQSFNPATIALTNPAFVAEPTSFNILTGDGVDGYISVPSHANYDFDRTQPFSVECMVQLQAGELTTTLRYLMTKFNATTGQGWHLYRNGDTGKLRFAFQSTTAGGTIQVETTGTQMTSAGVWYHVVATYSGNSNSSGLKLYINANEKPVTSITNTMTSGSATHTNPVEFLHRNTTGTNQYSTMRVAYGRLFNTALSEAQVNALWNGGTPSKTLPASVTSCVMSVFIDNATWNGTNHTGLETIQGGTFASVNQTQASVTAGDFSRYDATKKTYFSRNQGDESRIVNFQSQFAQGYYRFGRTYKPYMELGGPGFDNNKRIIYFDHQTKTWSKPYWVGKGTLGIDDKHLICSIFVSRTGHVLCGYEINHGLSGVRMVRTSVPGDLSTLTNGQLLEGSSVSGGANVIAYASFKQMSNGDIFCFFRQGYSQLCYYKSTDDGLTWSSAVTVMNLDRNGAVGNPAVVNWSYTGLCHNNDNNIYLWVTTTGSSSTGGGTTVFKSGFIYSDDQGLTWKNLSGSFSKAITGGTNKITYAEFHANYLLDNNAYSSRQLVVAPSGKLFLLNEDITTGQDYLYSGNLGGTWTGPVAITYPTTKLVGDNPFLIAHSDTQLDYLTCDVVSTKRQPMIYTSSNGGTSWTLKAQVTTDATINHNFLQTAVNAQEAPSQVLWWGAEVNAAYQDLGTVNYTLP